MLETIKFGEDRNPPLLFLHAFGASPRAYTTLFERMGQKFHVVAPLSSGLNGHCAVDFEKNLRNVQKVADQIRPEIVVGHSYGGALAYHLAGLEPNIRNVVLLNPLIPAAMDMARIATSARLMVEDLFNAEGDLRQSMTDAAFLNEYALNLLKDPAGFFRALPSANAAGHPAGKSAAHVHVLMGERDFMFPLNAAYLAQVRAAFGDYTYTPLPNYAHFWPFFRQQELAEMILNARGEAA